MNDCVYLQHEFMEIFIPWRNALKYLEVENILIAALLTVHLHGEQLTIIHPR